MPSVAAIHAFWLTRYSRAGERWFGQLNDDGPPSCYACQRDSGMLERSHLVDHCQGGSAAPWNLVLLCYDCNRRRMPSFGPGEWAYAVVWVRCRSTFWSRLVLAANMVKGYQEDIPLLARVATAL